MCTVMGTHLKLGSFAEYTGQLLGLLRVQHILYRHFLNNDECAEELAYTQVTTLKPRSCTVTLFKGMPVMTTM